MKVNKVIEKALDIAEQTLNSFRLSANKIEIFKFRATRLIELYESYDR